MNITTKIKTMLAAATVSILALSATSASAATVACGTDLAAKLTTNIGCEISDVATQDFLNSDPITVNGEEFFGTLDWTFVGKKNIGGVAEGSSPPTLSGANSGTMTILSSLWSTYGEIMAVFKSGNDTFLTGYKLNTDDTIFSYTNPFSKDISHISLYGRGDPTTNVVPLPAGMPLILGALGMLAFVRRRQNKA